MTEVEGSAAGVTSMSPSPAATSSLTPTASTVPGVARPSQRCRARHASAFTAAFDDVIVWEALAASKQAAADRYGVTWRAADNACVCCE